MKEENIQPKFRRDFSNKSVTTGETKLDEFLPFQLKTFHVPNRAMLQMSDLMKQFKQHQEHAIHL
jgi:hypothetical protein